MNSSAVMVDQSQPFPRALPELRPFLGFFPGMDCKTEPKDGVRPFFASFPPAPIPDPAIVTLKNVHVKGADGADLRLLVLCPAATNAPPEGFPVVVAMHGGGMIMASPELDLPFYSYLAQNGFVVVSPDYRLAPENPCPAAANDVLTAWMFVTSETGASQLGIDPKRAALYGSSAGSALAGGLAIRLNATKAHIQPALTILDSAALDDRLHYPSLQDGNPLRAYHVWTLENVRDSNAHVFQDLKARPVDVLPLRSQPLDLQGLGPHYITGAELDCLTDHAPTYARLLSDAGVSVGLRVWRGAFHAFMTFQPQTTVAEAARQDHLRALREVI